MNGKLLCRNKENKSRYVYDQELYWEECRDHWVGQEERPNVKINSLIKVSADIVVSKPGIQPVLE